MTRTLVFTRTKRGADRVAKTLEEAGILAAAIHGNKSQGQRERALAAFRGGKARALVATDIAARGIDIDGVSHVVNFELPDVAEAYVHRIGRTARAGKAGQAISLCDGAERDLLRAIERLTRLRLPTEDRRGANAPPPAPVLVKSATAPAPDRPHHAPHRDPRSVGQPPPQPARRRSRPTTGWPRAGGVGVAPPRGDGRLFALISRIRYSATGESGAVNITARAQDRLRAEVSRFVSVSTFT